ncbi:PREDICTED: low-density lipoprotein receptor class A domain-containing protein 2, partial [Nanorana parkeri]|uniref:low-density lipoprotein receptor class A domain-containing protein 2 n=1 Tax=Nanorana parkeri TaxID=125878 RepID=UPI000853F280
MEIVDEEAEGRMVRSAPWLCKSQDWMDRHAKPPAVSLEFGSVSAETLNCPSNYNDTGLRYIVSVFCPLLYATAEVMKEGQTPVPELGGTLLFPPALHQTPRGRHGYQETQSRLDRRQRATGRSRCGHKARGSESLLPAGGPRTPSSHPPEAGGPRTPSCHPPEAGGPPAAHHGPLGRNVKMAPRTGKTLRPLSPLFVVMSLMIGAAYPLETVNMADFCGQTIKGDGMIVNSHADSRKYYFVSVGTDCRLTMRAAALKDKVQFQFRFFLVYSLLRMSNMKAQTSGMNGSAHGPPAQETSSPPGSVTDPCNAGSYVQFYDGRDHHSEPLGTPLCGKTIPRPVLSTGNYLTLRLVTRGQQPRVDFVGDFTSFRIDCRNGKCIPSSLVCDEQNIDNCGDGSDQSSSPPASCRQDGGR